MTKEEFILAVQDLGISLTEQQVSQLEKFYQLLISWNEKMNLTRITAVEDVYLKHYYDSLTLLKAVDLSQVSTLCDVGTGAGFPGIVLKIVFPNLKVTLVDSLQKRVTSATNALAASISAVFSSATPMMRAISANLAVFS